MIPLETEEALEGALATSDEGEEPGGGAEGVLLPAEFDEYGVFTGNGNLTYMDVRILERSGGGGGGGGGKPTRGIYLPLNK